MNQHPTAIIDPKAEIDENVSIGPFSIIDGPVKIGSGTKIMSHAHISGYTEIGKDNEIHMGAVIGHVPQHMGYKECKSLTKIGDRNVFREYSTVHRSWVEGEATVIGDDNFFMGLSHVGHDCILGNHIIVANGVLIAGHVIVHDNAFLSGNSGFHQFCRVGRLAMVSGNATVTKDVPPFCIAAGRACVVGLNVIGMRRAGIDQKVRTDIKNAFKMLYKRGLNTRQALEAIDKSNPCEEVRYFADFIRESKRGICSLYEKER